MAQDVFNEIEAIEDRVMCGVDDDAERYEAILDAINQRNSTIEEFLEMLKGVKGIDLPRRRREARAAIAGAYKHLRKAESLLDQIRPKILKFFDALRRIHTRYPDLSYDQVGYMYFKQRPHLKNSATYTKMLIGIYDNLTYASLDRFNLDDLIRAFSADVVLTSTIK